MYLLFLDESGARHPSTNEVDGVGIKYFPDSTKPQEVNEAEVRLFNPRG